MHLLERLLAFDPERRCSAEEALAHEYFAHLDSSMHDSSECRPGTGHSSHDRRAHILFQILGFTPQQGRHWGYLPFAGDSWLH